MFLVFYLIRNIKAGFNAVGSEAKLGTEYDSEVVSFSSTFLTDIM
jgi:hypothetical protein